jgi:hypothetical protein
MTCIAAMPRVCGRTAVPPAQFRLPAGPVIPIIALLVCIALLTRVSLVSVIATAGLLAVGSVLYLVAWLLRPPGVQQP